MKSFSPALQDLIDAFKQLPGIGIKSAQRIAVSYTHLTLPTILLV